MINSLPSNNELSISETRKPLIQSNHHIRKDKAGVYPNAVEQYLPTFVRNTSRLAALSGCEIGFYGYAEDNQIRNLVGYVDYVIIQHAMYSGGATIRDNVIYLHQHGIKVILILGWWDIWPFTSSGVYGWRDMDKEDVVYGMNATEAVKYRINGLFSNIDPQYVWGVCISEEEPAGGTPIGYDTPWVVPAYYMNLFYDWLKVAYPDVLVFQWPSPVEFLTQQDQYGYRVKADGIAFDSYTQNYDLIRGYARDLKAQYPDQPLLYLTAAHDDLQWGTPHPPCYTKSALQAVAEYSDMIGFFCYNSISLLEGWRDPDHQYLLALELCNQTHIHDANTIYADTAWFQTIHNDSMTDSVDRWYRSSWYGWAEDPNLAISSATDVRVGTIAINLTQLDAGIGNFWYQPYSHNKYMGYDLGYNLDSLNFTDATRLSFWIKGQGWDTVTNPSVSLVFERQTAFYPTYYGNMTLPDLTSWLLDGAWHQVVINLPLSPDAYQSWTGTACQLRVVTNYTGSPLNNITTILFDGFDIQRFDNGVVGNLNTINDYAEEINGTLYLHGSATFMKNFTTDTPVRFSYAGTGSYALLANNTWHTMITNNSILQGIQGFRLTSGSWDWIRFNSLPTLTITGPTPDSLVTGSVPVTVQVDDPSGIWQVEYHIDGISRANMTEPPFTFTWNTLIETDTPHILQATAYNIVNETADHQISVIIDNSPPTLTFLDPTLHQRIANTIPVSLDVNDNQGIDHVNISLDTTPIITLSTPPWQWMWNTHHVSNGQHTLEAIAYDLVGHFSTTSVTVTVSNPTAPPPAPTLHQLADFDTDGTFTISWEITPQTGQQITGYILEMDNTDTFTGTPTQWVINQTYHEITELPQNHYYFRVQAQDNWTQLSPWSEITTILVQYPSPPIPGFPFEAILMGLLLILAPLVLLRKRKLTKESVT